jgi:hypothetical protein
MQPLPTEVTPGPLAGGTPCLLMEAFLEGDVAVLSPDGRAVPYPEYPGGLVLGWFLKYDGPENNRAYLVTDEAAVERFRFLPPGRDVDAESFLEVVDRVRADPTFLRTVAGLRLQPQDSDRPDESDLFMFCDYLEERLGAGIDHLTYLYGCRTPDGPGALRLVQRENFVDRDGTNRQRAYYKYEAEAEDALLPAVVAWFRRSGAEKDRKAADLIGRPKLAHNLIPVSSFDTDRWNLNPHDLAWAGEHIFYEEEPARLALKRTVLKQIALATGHPSHPSALLPCPVCEAAGVVRGTHPNGKEKDPEACPRCAARGRVCMPRLVAPGDYWRYDERRRADQRELEGLTEGARL